MEIKIDTEDLPEIPLVDSFDNFNGMIHENDSNKHKKNILAFLTGQIMFKN